ncbi:hypothetical protein ROHU_023109 [Labeo rohita]|uniref:Uncharacterized protein n=1 Tax=Labeo rohita TaxID=84645 RepID=A0A498MTH2_LABRO|nr:hypothetical protein ROHU_023109 [Labeo rohita]
MLALPRGGQNGVHGPVTCVPSNVTEVVNVLPRIENNPCAMTKKDAMGLLRSLNEKQSQIFYKVRQWCLAKVQGRSGEGVDVLCGRATGVTVIPNLTFPYKQPPSKCKQTMGDIRKMSARQYVGELTGRIVDLGASAEMVEIQGRQVET